MLKKSAPLHKFFFVFSIPLMYLFSYNLCAQVDSLQTPEYHINLGNAFNHQGKFEDAITSYLLAVTILENKKDSTQLATVYTNIGVVNAKLKNFDKAIQYLEKSLPFFGNNENLKLRALYNISAFYFDKKDIETSILKSKSAEIIAKKLNEKRILSGIYSNYCNNYRALKEYDNSILYGLKSLALKEELKLNPDITINNIGYSYLLKGDSKTAIAYFLKIKNTSNRALKVLLFNNLRTAYKNMNRNDLALQFSDSLLNLKDSIHKQQQNIKVAELVEKYESDKKQQEINLLNTKNELQNSKLNNQKYLLIGGGLTFLLLVLLGYLWFQNQKTKQSYIQASIRHKLLQTQLNPHFLFHSLNNIQTFIFNNKKESSVNYLASYSKLMRSIFDSSSADFITIEKDMEAMQAYLNLQKVNLNDTIDFSLESDEAISHFLIPPMFVQPYIENAIQHGAKDIEIPKLSVHYQNKETHICVMISDNGKGFEKKNNNRLLKENSSSKVIEQRIKNFEKTHNYKIRQDIITNKNGTKVLLKFPKKET